MAGLGSLVVKLAADIASFQSDLGKASHIATRVMVDIQGAARRAGLALGGLLSIGGAFAMVRSAINAADALDELQERTGVTANELLVLQGAASRSGLGMDAAGELATKLTKRLQEASKGTGDTAAAFEAMKISVTDAAGNLKNTDVILGEIAKKFDGYADGANKAALAEKTLGKGGDRFIPMLSSLEAVRKRYQELGITIEQDTLKRAAKFNDTLDDLKDVQNVLATQIASKVLPHMQQLAEAMISVTQDASNMSGIFEAIILVLKVAATGFYTLYTAVAATGEVLVGFNLALLKLAQFDPKGAFDELVNGALRAEQRFQSLANTVTNLFAEPKRETTSRKGRLQDNRPQAPRFGGEEGAKAAADALEKLRDDRTKRALDAVKLAAAQEQALLDRYHAENLVSEENYWRTKLQIAKQTLDSELALLDSQLKRQQDAIDRAAKGSKEHSSALNDLEASQAQRNKLEAEFRQFAQITYLDASKAARAYKDDIERLNIEMLELQGRTADAAREAERLRNRDLRAKFSANNDQGALQLLDNVEKLRIARAQVSEIDERTALILGDLEIKEARIQNSRRTGAISELDALQRTDAARKETVRLLEAQYQAQLRIAQSAGQGNEKLLQDAEKLKVRIEELAAQSDLLAEKFETIFKDSFADAITQAVEGTKSLKEAFRDMANSIVQQITRLAAQDIATKIFGGMTGKGGGGGGGTDSFASGLFGGLGKLFGFGGGGWPWGGMGSMAGSSAGSAWSGLDLFDFPTFAKGIDYVPFDMNARIHRGERVVPADENGKQGMTVVNNFTVSGSVDSRSQSQIAALASLSLNRGRKNL